MSDAQSLQAGPAQALKRGRHFWTHGHVLSRGGKRVETETTIEVAHGERSVRITLHERLWAASPDPWDRDAISATIEARDPITQPGYASVLWSSDLRELRRYLRELGGQDERACSTCWMSLERTLSLTPIREQGALSLIVAVRDRDAGVVLQVTLAVEETGLPLVIAQIDAALRRYPPHMRADVSGKRAEGLG